MPPDRSYRGRKTKEEQGPKELSTRQAAKLLPGLVAVRGRPANHPILKKLEPISRGLAIAEATTPNDKPQGEDVVFRSDTLELESMEDHKDWLQFMLEEVEREQEGQKRGGRKMIEVKELNDEARPLVGEADVVYVRQGDILRGEDRCKRVWRNGVSEIEHGRQKQQLRRNNWRRCKQGNFIDTTKLPYPHKHYTRGSTGPYARVYAAK